MYSTKQFNHKADSFTKTGFLQEKYENPAAKRKDAKLCGKQFSTSYGVGRTFSKFSSLHTVPGGKYTSDPYTKPSPYVAFKGNQAAFGSKDASKRDEYSDQKNLSVRAAPFAPARRRSRHPPPRRPSAARPPAPPTSPPPPSPPSPRLAPSVAWACRSASARRSRRR